MTLRKVALRVVKKKQKLEILVSNLEEFVGKPHPLTVFNVPPAGVCMTLGQYTNLYVESICDDFEKTGLKTYEQLGKVMQESMKLSYLMAKTCLSRLAPENKFFSGTRVYMHILGRDEDTADIGCAMVTSLISLALAKPLPPNLAISAEITLKGTVLPVGSLYDKVLAAKRASVKSLILAQGNKSDWDKIPSQAKSDIKAHFVKKYDEIIKIVFPNLLKRI